MKLLNKSASGNVTTSTAPSRPAVPERSAEPSTAPSHNFGAVLYGPSGVGKTSFAANFPNCAFIIDPQERGIHDLIAYHQCPSPKHIFEVNGWKHLLSTVDKTSSQKGIHTVCFDSLTGLEQLCFRYHCKQYFNDDWTSTGFFAFMQGPKNAAKRDWPELMEAVENLKGTGKNVILIGHSQVKTFNNPEGPDYDRFSPALDKETWAATHRWASMVLFYKFQVDIRKEGPRSKANAATEKRLICTVHSSQYDAKNRYGLEPVIQAGDSGETAYQAFHEAFVKAGN